MKILWPGKIRNVAIKQLEDYYLHRINQLEPCEIIATRQAKGLSEKNADRIKEVEAQGLEKHIKDDYVICLFDKGKEMSSSEFSQFLKNAGESSTRLVTFVVGGFLGLAERMLDRADLLLSLSAMTFSHELSRIMLLEQIYRSLSIAKGRQYAK
ncbi:MAG: 23S rRNA (pseudouridine(1915)-N(3))-methyltransferase RlmH [Candidatus Aminicenantes bacterium]|nr:23S rRNA (pseudouridine(1915)-N(3))-methyltransferase RlmH [Candidatus Aminicenantes bacterium]